MESTETKNESKKEEQNTESFEAKNESKKEEEIKVKKSPSKKIKKEKIQETNLKYEELLINKIDMEYMHQRYLSEFSFFKSFKEMLQTYQESYNEFFKKITTIKANFITDKVQFAKHNANKEKEKENEQKTPKNSLENTIDSISLTCHELFALIINQAYSFQRIATSIGALLSKYPSNIKQLSFDKKEKDLQYSFKNINKSYISSRDTLKKNKIDYENNFSLLEKMIKDSLENKVDQSKVNQKINYLKTARDKYKSSVEDANKKKEEKIKNEKELLQIYQSIDSDFFFKIKDIIGNVLDQLNKERNNFKKVCKKLEQNYNMIDLDFDTAYKIKKCENDNKKLNIVEEHFEYKPYEPKSKLPQLTTINPIEKEINDFNINYEIVSKIKKNFEDIYPEINLKEETQKINIREKLKKMFYSKENYDFSREDKDTLLSLLRTKQNRKFFIILLSNQRTKGRYQYCWKLINDLGDILRFILNLSEKEEDYEIAKNCIIISQTFFSEKKDSKKKIYLFEYIKNHHWLKSPNFWEKITDIMVDKEIENNNEILGKEALKKESETQKKDRLSQVYVSQMYTFSQNMVEFDLKKDDIYRIIDKTAEKYDVIDTYKKTIYDNVVENLEKKPKNDLKIEEDEISYFIKKRQRTLIKPSKKIKINNHTFNKIKKTHNKNKQIKKFNSSYRFPTILKLERNKIFDNIKLEMQMDEYYKTRRKTLSEIITQKNDNSNTSNMAKQKSKSCKLREEEEEKEGKNEILIEENKNQVNEIKKEEPKKEEPKKEEPKNEEPKKEEPKKEEPKKEEQKKEEEPKEENGNIKEEEIEIIKKEDTKEEEKDNKKEETNEQTKIEEQKNEIKENDEK